ncbi:MAG: hypothetical protein Q9157_003703 [Trypethelium eluteriae]
MSDIKVFLVDEPYLKINCKLGEAPFWEESRQTLRFVDIVQQQVHSVNVVKGPASHEVHADLDISIGTTADIEGHDENEFLFGGKHGFGLYNRHSGRYRYLRKYWTDDEVAHSKEHRMRANDGAVDINGRFWLGTMNDPLVQSPTNEGILFRLDPDLTLHRILEGVTIPNGISFSEDNTKFFFTDSVTGSIDVFDFNSSTGDISNRRVFFKVAEEGSAPDGHCRDEEGYIWAAIFGGGKVVRIDPTGKVVAEIHLPTRCVTCPCFVGTDLYITTAAEEEPEQYPDSTRLAGSLFKCSVGVKGAQPYRFSFAKVSNV